MSGPLITSGCASGRGYADGTGYGSGSGLADGSVVKSYNGYPVELIDNVQTLIYHRHGDIIEGAILQDDLSLTPCFVVTVEGYTAHGATLREAHNAAQAKALQALPVEDRITAFVEAHPDLDTPYDDLFEWHHTLTGSCKLGREAWCRDHNLNPTDAITVRRFIDLTKDAYRGDIIKQLAKEYNYECN